jgi:single-strand DNA-binding protein
MIKLTAIGNLGNDCVVNTVNGKQVINFSVAHTEKFKDNQGTAQQKTTWIGCNYWSDSKVAQYLKKGTLVYVEGTPEVKTYEGRNGIQAEMRVRVHAVQLLGGNKDGQRSQNEPVHDNVNDETGSDISTSKEDLPF